MNDKKYDICIIGGLGHVGLPLGIVFASKGYKVCLNDINKDVADQVKSGELPYVEYDAKPLLKKTLANDNLSISLDSKSISICCPSHTCRAVLFNSLLKCL